VIILNIALWGGKSRQGRGNLKKIKSFLTTKATTAEKQKGGKIRGLVL
jgi:hypothetical protein